MKFTTDAGTLLFFILPFSFLPPAFADDNISPDRPGIADGSTVLAPKTFEVEVGVEGDYSNGSKNDERDYELPTLLRLGLTDDLEARFESNTISYSRSYDAGATDSTSGVAPMSAGIKYQFLHGDGDSPTAGAILRVFPPSGSSEFRTKHLTSDLRLAYDQAFQSLSFEANLGAGVYEDDDGEMFGAALGAATLTYSIDEAIAVFIDSGTQEPEGKHESIGVIVDGGVTYLVNRDTQLDISIGGSAAGSRSADLFWGAGVARRFSIGG